MNLVKYSDRILKQGQTVTPSAVLISCFWMLLVFLVLILTYRSISFYYFRFKSIVCMTCFWSRCPLNCWLLCFELQINSELWIWRATPGACLGHSWHFQEHFCFIILYICSVVWTLSHFLLHSLSIMYNLHLNLRPCQYISSSLCLLVECL